MSETSTTTTAATATATATAPTRTANPNAPLSGVGGSVGEAGLIAIIWVFFATATILMFLRLAVRFRQHRSFLSDDYWMMLAWTCLLTMFSLQMAQVPALWYFTHLRAGRVLPDEKAIYWQGELKRWQFPIIKLFYTVLWSVKAGFLAVFYRLVKPFTILRRLWYAVAVFTVLAYIGCILQSALACRPPADYFKPGKCNSPQDFWMQRFGMRFSTAVDVSSDIMIMALPISILPSLQLDIRRKIGLGVAFSIGIIIIAVSIVRMTQVTLSEGDAIDIIGLAVWGAIESSTAVVVGSLLPLKALISRSVQKYSSRSNPLKANYGPGMRSATLQGGGSGGHGAYGPNSISRTVMVAESIPLDDMHTSTQKDGGIYVQRSYETTFDEASSRDDDEAGIVNKIRPGHAV